MARQRCAVRRHRRLRGPSPLPSGRPRAASPWPICGREVSERCLGWLSGAQEVPWARSPAVPDESTDASKRLPLWSGTSTQAGRRHRNGNQSRSARQMSATAGRISLDHSRSAARSHRYTRASPGTCPHESDEASARVARWNQTTDAKGGWHCIAGSERLARQCGTTTPPVSTDCPGRSARARG